MSEDKPIGLAYSRGEKLCVWPEKMPYAFIHGVGTVGSYLTLPLSKMPWSGLTLIDPDTIEEVNIPYQNFVRAELGKPKAHIAWALTDSDATTISASISKSEAVIEGFVKEFPDSFHFGCIDNLTSKAYVLDCLRPGCVWIDIRTAGTQFQSSLLLLESREEIDRAIIELLEQAESIKDQDPPPCGYSNVIENGLWTAAITASLVRHFFNEGISAMVMGNNETCDLAYTILKGKRKTDSASLSIS